MTRRLAGMLAALVLGAFVSPASAATVIVGYDEHVLALREAQAAENETREYFFGLTAVTVELTDAGANFQSETGEPGRLFQLLQRNLPADGHLRATRATDGGTLVAYSDERLARMRPDPQALLTWLRTTVQAIEPSAPAPVLRGDGRFEVRLSSSESVRALEARLRGATSIAVFPVGCTFLADDPPESTCDGVRPDMVDPSSGNRMILGPAPILTGDMFTRWSVTPGPLTGSQGGYVEFRLNAEGARRFSAYTAGHVEQAVAIVFQGRVLSAPVIQSRINGAAGMFPTGRTGWTASELAEALLQYAPPLELRVLEVRED